MVELIKGACSPVIHLALRWSSWSASRVVLAAVGPILGKQSRQFAAGQEETITPCKNCLLVVHAFLGPLSLFGAMALGHCLVFAR